MRTTATPRERTGGGGFARAGRSGALKKEKKEARKTRMISARCEACVKMAAALASKAPASSGALPVPRQLAAAPGCGSHGPRARG
jgi:hypothetical protein